LDRMHLKNRDRFLRSFCRTVEENGLSSRLGLKKGAFVGRRTGKGFVLYRSRFGAASLFALTLWGSFEKDGGRDVLKIRFGRSVPVAVLWILWCCLMLLAGLLLVGSAPLASLWFLLPALLGTLPLFLYSKKEKERLLAYLREIEESGK